MDAFLNGAVAAWAWPICVLLILTRYRHSITAWAESVQSVEFRGWKLTKAEGRDVLHQLLMEMDRLIGRVPLEVRKRVVPMVEARTGEVRVDEMFPGFLRGTEPHRQLQALREAQILRPVGGGRWAAEKQIELKPFGRLLLQHRRAVLVGE